MKQNKQARKNHTSNEAIQRHITEVGTRVNTKKSPNSDKGYGLDKLKIFLSLLVLGLSIFGFFYFKAPNTLFSTPNLIVAYLCPILGVGVFLSIIFYWCSFGRNIINYIVESTGELKKVAWPDRTLATRMTILVILFVFILALLIWVFDTFLQWILYKIILGQGH